MSFPKAISQGAMKAFNSEKNQIETAVVNRSMKDKEDIIQHGENAENILTSGINFTSEIMASIMMTGDPELLKDQISWSNERLVYDGVKPKHIKKRLRYFIIEIEDRLPEEYASEIAPYFKWMINNFQ